MKWTRLVAIVVLLLSAVAVASMMTSSSKYVTFSEAQAHAGKQYYVIGQLSKSDPMVYDPIKDPNYLEFYMIDNEGRKVRVIYPGPKPQDFERSEQVVVTGAWDEEAGVFRATKVLLKCPSKYIEEEVARS